MSRGRDPRGLAEWTAAARPGTATITVELPGERVSARRASRLAYAIDRLAGTRFAAGATSDRRNLIAHGRDPPDSWHRFGADLSHSRVVFCPIRALAWGT